MKTANASAAAAPRGGSPHHYFGALADSPSLTDAAHFEVAICCAGGAVLWDARRRLVLQPFSLVCFSSLHGAKQLHSDAEAWGLRLWLPLSFLAELCIPHRVKQKLLHGEICVADAAKALESETVARWAEELACQDDYLKDLVWDEIALLLRRLFKDALGPDACVARPAAEPTGSCRHVHKMVDYMNERYCESISVADVAAHVRLHKNFAMGLFKQVLDMTILEYLTQLRVNHAARLLTTTSLRASQIAFESGFSSITRFYEVFARSFSQSPCDYRKSRRV
ncbi:helix-turn-helix domain-containing protein [Hahella sp. NBU794]|uniref:helix-turn-helix domain-containing protein n=1 Tax=Hahella sp. NBU794 TaxID=3422590 RepID=UPI003D6E21ED